MSAPSSTWAVILAAGSGTRMAQACGGVRKQFLDYQGLPLFWHSARALARVAPLGGLVFVFPPEELEASTERIRQLGVESLGLPWRVAPGGARRQDSVCNGLSALPPQCGRVLIHDSARPFASASLSVRLLQALDNGALGAIPVLPVTDTIKRIAGTSGDGTVVETLRRAELAAVQTPQAFVLAPLVAAHRRALEENWDVTDDASLLELAGQAVHTVLGEPGNVKITNPEDLRMLEDAARHPVPVTGFGYDVHAYAREGYSGSQPARPLILGGVPIPGGARVLAHSDGDVLLHAITDAVLGAAGLGDIGQLFPDNDPAFDNAVSSLLLAEALRIAGQKGLTLVHADLTVIAQVPRLGPHREAIRANVAELLGLPQARVGLKFTTEERLGFTGRKEGLKAVAVVSGHVAA